MKSSSAIRLFVSYTLVAIALGGVLILGDLPDQLLAILMVPPVLVSVSYRRWVYLSMTGVLLGVSIWVTYHLALSFPESLQTVAVAVIVTAGMCEAVSWLANRQRHAEERYRELFENANDIIYTHDLEGRMLSINQAGERISGYTREERLGKDIMEVVAPEHRDLARGMVVQKLQGEEPTQYEVDLVTKDGRRVPIEVSTRMIYQDGAPVAVQGIARDITDRRRAEATLREESSFRRAIIESSAEGLCVCHQIEEFPHVAFTVWNQRMIEITGYTMEEINRLGWYQSVYPDPEVQQRAIDRMGRMREGDNLYAEEWEITRKDDEKRTVSISTSIVEAQDDLVHVLALMHDVTRRKLAEEERWQLEAQVQHAQKLESLGVLAGGIAHDFNNLLVGILGNAGLALMKLSPESPVRSYIERLEAAGQRAAELTNQMLAYSGRGAFVVEPLNMTRLVEEMGHLLEASISKKATFSYHLPADLPLVEGDPAQLRQVLMNLIINASDALGDEPGVITLRAGTKDVEQGYLPGIFLRDDLPEGRYVRLEVADTGCGMDAETRERIFDPFFTTKFAGRGLGLAAVLGIVRGHKGAIKVYSEPGQGTTFALFLPVAEDLVEPVETVAKTSADDARAWRGAGTVLVADDEETVRDVARRVLEDRGFTVLLACDGQEAVDMFRSHADDICAVLLDLSMPALNGKEALREIHGIRADVPAILSSGYTEEDAIDQSSTERPAAFIQKPYAPNELVATLRAVLEA